MSYSIKLKNQTGTETPYNEIEEIVVPLTSGSGNATFAARYNVLLPNVNGVSCVGGETACYGCDYTAAVSIDETAVLPEAVTVAIVGKALVQGEDYEYERISNSHAIVRVYGKSITGVVSLTVTPSYLTA
jgi:hypothetical protein